MQLGVPAAQIVPGDPGREHNVPKVRFAIESLLKFTVIYLLCITGYEIKEKIRTVVPRFQQLD